LTKGRAMKTGALLTEVVRPDAAIGVHGEKM